VFLDCWKYVTVPLSLPLKRMPRLSAIANKCLTDIKFLLLHESKSEDAIRNFFTDVYDLYTKTLMNPFYSVNQTITSPIFDQRVRTVAKKYL
jgi:hypothetical protein